jgi:hypothetical protein
MGGDWSRFGIQWQDYVFIVYIIEELVSAVAPPLRGISQTRKTWRSSTTGIRIWRAIHSFASKFPNEEVTSAYTIQPP